MSTAPLRLGFVGAGGNTTARHLPGFHVLENVSCRAVANRTRASGERVAAAFGIARVETDWRAVVEAADVDAVCIGTWPDLHAEVTCAALAAGKHVLCEARMDATLAGAERMMAASSLCPERVAQLVPAPHTLAVDDLVQAWLAADYGGELRSVEVWHEHGDYANPLAPISWRLQQRHSGVNMLTLGIFYEVLLRWLDADAEVTSARGVIATARRPDSEGGEAAVDLPEAVEVQGVFPTLGGVTLRMVHSGLAPTPRMEIRLCGARADLRWDGRRGAVDTRPAGADDSAWSPLGSAGADAWRVERDFVASVRDDEPVRRTDFATGLRYMRFTDAAWRSLGWA